MKKICSYLSQLLVAVMLLSMLVPTVGAAETTLEETNPVVLSDAQKAAPVILSNLGFADEKDAEKDLTEPMSRAEFAVLLIRMRGINDITPTYYDKREFVDVNAEYYEDSFIRLAVELGYIEEAERGWFHPKEAVSYIAAVKGFVKLLGFETFAEKQGGTDAAYLAVASQIKANKSAKQTSNGLITRGDIYAMAVDCLDIDILDADSTDAKNALAVEKGRNLLSAYHDIYEGDGVVTANEFTSLSQAGDGAGDGRVKIGGNDFAIENDAFSSLLGYRVSYYYEEADGDKTLLHAAPYKTEVLTVDAEDIIKYSQRTYSYYDEESDKFDKISVKGCYMIYNGVSAEGRTYTSVPQNGEITFIDNDSDGEYDVCLINSYDEYVVKRTDADREMIYSEYGKTLDISEADSVVFRYADQTKSAALSDLVAGQVLSVSSDLDNDVLQIIISTTQASGAVNERTIEGKTELVIDGSRYAISSAMQTAVDNNQIKDVTIGRSYSFSLNHKGEIAYYNSAAGTAIGEYEYGILLGATKGKGLSNELKVKIFTSLGMFEVFPLAEKLYLDEVAEKDMDKVYTELCKNGENGEVESEVVPQLIRFRLNHDLMVTHIDRAGNPDPSEEGLYFSYDLSNSNSGDGAYYNSDVYGFTEGRLKIDFTISKNAIVFSVPMENGRITRDENSFILEGNAFANGIQYKTIFYKTDPKLINQEVVLLANESGPTGTEVKSEADINVFLKGIQALDNEGSPATKIYFSKDGTESSIFVDSTINIKAIPLKSGGTYSLKPGDIFRYNMDATGRINAIEAVYDCANDRFLGENASGDINQLWHPNTTMYLRRMNVHTVSSADILACYGHPSAVDMTDTSTFYIAPTTNKKNGTFEYDREKKTVRKITYEDIFDYTQAGEHYSKGFYWSRYADTRTVIIYK